MLPIEPEKCFTWLPIGAGFFHLLSRLRKTLCLTFYVSIRFSLENEHSNIQML